MNTAKPKGRPLVELTIDELDAVVGGDGDGGDGNGDGIGSDANFSLCDSGDGDGGLLRATDGDVCPVSSTLNPPNSIQLLRSDGL